MKALPTSLPGVVLVELREFRDARGVFVETFRRDRYLELGIGVGLEFVQDNYSTSVARTLRGLHYQLGAPQGKLVHVTRGEIFDICVDLRRSSPTFKQWFGAVLSAENHRQMWVPPGFAHGFFATSDIADVSYKMTATYSPADDRALRWNDPTIAIEWPAGTDAALLSAKDANAPFLDDAELPR